MGPLLILYIYRGRLLFHQTSLPAYKVSGPGVVASEDASLELTLASSNIFQRGSEDRFLFVPK